MVQNLAMSKRSANAAMCNCFVLDKAHPWACISLLLLYKAYLCFGVRSVEGFKINLIRSEEHFQSYCNKIFAGWDFCITNRSMADLKHSSLRYELRVSADAFSLGGFLAAGRGATPGPGCPQRLARFLFVVFAENSFLSLFTLGPKMEPVNLGWEGRWDVTVGVRRWHLPSIPAPSLLFVYFTRTCHKHPLRQEKYDGWTEMLSTSGENIRK